MKPFNLEQALAGKPVVTRGGVLNPEWYYFKTIKSKYPITMIVNGNPYLLEVDGTHNPLGDHSEIDLFMKEEEVTMYVYVYRDEKDLLQSALSRLPNLKDEPYFKILNKFPFTVKQ